MRESREVMAGNHKHTQSKNQLNLEIDCVRIQTESLYSLTWPASGNARSARRASPSATPGCACSPTRASPGRRWTRSPRPRTSRARRSSPTSRPRRRSSSATAAPRSRAWPPACSGDHEGTVAVVREWLTELAGWFEPELVLQHRLAREVPDRRRAPAAALRRGRARHRRRARSRARARARRTPGRRRRWSPPCASPRRPRPLAWSRRSARSARTRSNALLANAVAFAEAGIAAIG